MARIYPIFQKRVGLHLRVLVQRRNPRITNKKTSSLLFFLWYVSKTPISTFCHTAPNGQSFWNEIFALFWKKSASVRKRSFLKQCNKGFFLKVFWARLCVLQQAFLSGERFWKTFFRGNGTGVFWHYPNPTDKSLFNKFKGGNCAFFVYVVFFSKLVFLYFCNFVYF